MPITQLRKEAVVQILTTPVRDVQLDNGQKSLLRASSWKKLCPVHSSPRAVNWGRWCGRGNTGFGVGRLGFCLSCTPCPGSGNRVSLGLFFTFVTWKLLPVSLGGCENKQ